MQYRRSNYKTNNNIENKYDGMYESDTNDDIIGNNISISKINDNTNSNYNSGYSYNRMGINDGTNSTVK